MQLVGCSALVLLPVPATLGARDFSATLIGLEHEIAVGRFDDGPNAMSLSIQEVNLDRRLGAGGLNMLGERGRKVRFIEHDVIASAWDEDDMTASRGMVNSDAPNDVAKAHVSTGNTPIAPHPRIGVTMFDAPP